MTPVASEVFDEPLINFELLEDYFGDEPETIQRLLTLFESTTTALLGKLEQAIHDRDASSTHALAHELRGSCGNIGIDRMARIATELETAADAQQWTRVDTLQRCVADTFKATLQARSGS